MHANPDQNNRPLEEDPEWALFLPFDSLEFSFVGGSIGVTRPIPQAVCG